MIAVDDGVATLARRTTDVLDHPLCGRSPRRTRAAVSFLLAVVALYVGRQTLTAHAAGAESLAPTVDLIADVLIFAVAVTITVLPISYAIWNGGPALSFLGPLVPVAIGDLVAGSYVLDLDVVVALTTGTAAAAVAVYAADVRDGRTWLPWRDDARDEDGLVFVTAVSVVAGVGVIRFVLAMPPYIVEWYAPFGVLWLLPASIVPAYWNAWLRSAFEERRGVDSPEI